jgi:hypothetical protein
MSKGCKDEVIKIGGYKVKVGSLDEGLLNKINTALGTDVLGTTGCCGGGSKPVRCMKCNINKVKGRGIYLRNIKKYGMGRKGSMEMWKSKG